MKSINCGCRVGSPAPPIAIWNGRLFWLTDPQTYIDLSTILSKFYPDDRADT